MSLSEQEFEELVRPVIENIVQSHANGDYAQASIHFSDELKSGITQKSSEEARESKLKDCGKASSIEFLGSVKNSNRTILLWRAVHNLEEVLWQVWLSKDNDVKNIIGLKYL